MATALVVTLLVITILVFTVLVDTGQLVTVLVVKVLIVSNKWVQVLPVQCKMESSVSILVVTFLACVINFHLCTIYLGEFV